MTLRGLAWIAAIAALAMGAATPASAQRVQDIEVLSRQFPSGLRAVVARTPAVPGRPPRAYVTVYVGHGSLQETRLGRSHLIEHVAANSAPAIDLPAPPPGMEVFAANALTKPNFLSFVRTVSPDGVDAVIPNRLARIGRVVPTDALFAKEKGRVIEELEKSISRSSDFVAWKALEAHANGKPASLAEELASVRAETQAPALAEMAAAFVPGRSVIVVAGDVDPRAAMAVIERAAARLALDAETKPANAQPARGLRTDRPPLTIAQNPAGVFVTAVGFTQPDPGSTDYPAFLVLDQLVMGGRDIGADGPRVARSDDSPLGVRLDKSLGATKLWDGREQAWGVAPWAEGEPGMWAILFRTEAQVDAAQVKTRLRAALRDIRANAMGDREIIAARDKLAAFYENWLLEPTYRNLGDHLAAFASAGLDPERVGEIPDAIRKASPASVRRMMDREILVQSPLIVATVPASR